MGGSAAKVAPDDPDARGARLEENRGCTDIICLIIWLTHWGLFLFVTFFGASHGNPSKLYSPRDFRGEYCGIATNWNNGLNLENQKMMSSTMNTTHSVELIAKQLVCSTAAENSLKLIMTQQQLLDYRCACCKRACSSCFGSLNMIDFKTPADLASTISNKMGDLTTTANAGSLFSTDGANGNYFANMWDDATSFFNDVCLPLCNTPLTTDLNTTYRTYTYSPPPGAPWREAWDVLKSNNANVASDISNTVNNTFVFKALPSNICPYDPRYCVPFPGVEFVEDEYNYCSFRVSKSVTSSVGQAAASTFADIGANALSSASSSNFGSAMGDIMSTLDALISVGICSLVIGLIFLVLIRFFIAPMICVSLFFVFIAFLASGACLYIRSLQCKGASLFDTGKQATDAVTIAATAAYANTDLGGETLTGNGASYRGAQDQTRYGLTCQAWDALTPHNHTTTPALYNNSGLIKNYCRNPTNASTIWCYTVDPIVRWQICDPIGVLRPECKQGYVVESETGRDVMEYLSYVLYGFGALWIIFCCCFQKRIRLAIGICEAAAMFLYQTPSVVLVPIIQVITAIIWLIVWTICAVFFVSQVPADSMATGYYGSWLDANGPDGSGGKCTDGAIAGFVWVDEGLPLSADNPCSGNMGNLTGITPQCYRCAPPRFNADVGIWLQLFSLFWTNNFLIGIGQVIIAVAVCMWFFEDKKGKSVFRGLVPKATKMTFRYHTGSVAFGSFILAIVQIIRLFCYYLQKVAEAKENKVTKAILCVFGYCMWVFEKCVKFLNKNAYIQVAVKGDNFCTAAKNAFFLILRNMMRFAIVATLGSIINVLGLFFIMAATVGLGYFILMGLHPNVHPALPMMLYVILSYVVAKLYMNVLLLAIDTMLHCFIATEEMPKGEDKSFVPQKLQKFLDTAPTKDQAKENDI